MEKGLPGKISLEEIISTLRGKENESLPLKGTKEKKTSERQGQMQPRVPARGRAPSSLLLFGCLWTSATDRYSCGLGHCWLCCKILIILKVCVSKAPSSR